MKVFKFGGASVKDSEAVKNVGNILKQQGLENIFVVISAMGKTTNNLEKYTASLYENRKHAAEVLITIKQFRMPSFKVNVTIENKPEISDPEGDTILNDLILKDHTTSVKKVHSAKMLKFDVEAKNRKIAEKVVIDLCNEFRIYNPLVSKMSIESFDV